MEEAPRHRPDPHANKPSKSMNQTPTTDAKLRRLTAAAFSVFAAATAFAQADGMSDKKDEAVTLDKFVVTETLQQAGVAAGPMNRPPDVLADPQIEYRKLFTEMAHPLFGARS